MKHRALLAMVALVMLSCIVDEQSLGRKASPEGGVCNAPNPEGCVIAGCPADQLCFPTPPGCVPSSCSCDGPSGAWICTSDCGGGICRFRADASHPPRGDGSRE
jgi:hypothetical protein